MKSIAPRPDIRKILAIPNGEDRLWTYFDLEKSCRGFVNMLCACQLRQDIRNYKPFQEIQSLTLSPRRLGVKNRQFDLWIGQCKKCQRIYWSMRKI
jgi:hypothetical protein